MNKGLKLWNRAKKIISGGGMLLSKKPEMFAPDLWPAYYSKSQGCYVWSLENKKYTDVSLMGVGTNILGYNHLEVNEAVKKVITKGNLTTLNSPEEVELAENLLKLHSWADMVKFARTGGEANAIAIRIARAASGKDNIAICGYHGWNDWYLAANLKSRKNLDNHLLSGLNPLGVPKKLKNSVFPFEFNDLDKLKELIKKRNIGIVKMEVSSNGQYVVYMTGHLATPFMFVTNDFGSTWSVKDLTSISGTKGGFNMTSDGMYRAFIVQNTYSTYYESYD
jgi:glutamate-1-semialdehyde 2,1-aminomutase